MSGHLTPTWGNRCHNKGRRAISCDWGKICGHAKLCCILFRVHISHISSQSLIADVADKCNKCKYENVTQVPESILSGFTTDQNPLPYIQRAAAIPSGLEKKSIRTLGVADNLCCVRKWQGSQCVPSCLVQNWNPSLSSTTPSLHWEWVWRWLWVYKGKLIGRKFITKLRQTEVDSNSPQGVIEC